MAILDSAVTPAPGIRTGCLGRMIQGTLFLAILVISFSGQLWAWIGSALTSTVNATWTTAITAALILGLMAPFAFAWRPIRERAIYRTWFVAGLYVLLLSPTRLFPPTENVTVTLLQLAITLVFALVLWLRLRGMQGRSTSVSGWGVALAAAAVFVLPWVTRGALGSAVESLVSLLLGLTFGTAVSLLFALFWLPSLQRDSRGRGADIFTGGLVLGASIACMGSGLSLNGLQLPLMFALPALGFAAAGLAYAPDGFDWRSPALLIGLSAAAPVAFTDVGTMALEAGDPALGWAWQAAIISVVVGWLLALATLLSLRRSASRLSAASAWGLAAVLWAVVGLVYFVDGQPGFYGDRLFVILKPQADVSFAAKLDDYAERRQAVYTTLVDHANASQAELRADLDRWHLRYTPYYLVNAIEVEGGPLVRLLLSWRAGVDRILPSPRLRPLPEPLNVGQEQEALPAGYDWNLAQIGAERVWQELGARGAGIVVGQSDSGVDVSHPELADGYRGGTDNDYAWYDPWSDSSAPVDYGGHGTHTLATVLGNTTGVAPDATWIACANLQRNLGNPALYLDCLQFMLAPFPSGGDPFRDGDPLQSAYVLNNSWGCPQQHEGCDPASLQPAVDALRAAGIFVVASAGNDGPDCSTIADPIAMYDAAFAVGAVDRDNNLASFSSAGPVTVDGSGRNKPDVAAPGVDIWSAYPRNQYAKMSGTSMAGPHVAGIVALMWSANPALLGDIDRTEQILRDTARPFSGKMENPDLLGSDGGIPDSAALVEPAIDSNEPAPADGACILMGGSDKRPNNLVGYGVVDAYAAVQAAMALTK